MNFPQMQVSSSSRMVSDVLISTLIKVEVKLYTKINSLMELKVKVGQRLFSMGANEANIKKCTVQCQMLDDEVAPLMKEHQQVVAKLKAYGVIVTHN